jgi:hypothetical protein
MVWMSSGRRIERQKLMNRADCREAAVLLRRLLAAVDAGELTVGTPRAVALVRHMEGAAVAFELSAGLEPGGSSQVVPLDK